MVDVERSADACRCRFVLRPNSSLSWRGLKLFFLSLCVVSGVIATGLSLMGFWLVLPFTGLELLALGGGLYLVALRCQEREVIDIGVEAIRIERGRTGPRRCWVLGRGWARAVLERPPGRWYPSRLLIRSRGRSVEVGRFLSEEERQRLALELQRSL